MEFRKKSSIATVISFCTNDWRFLDKNIKEAKLFSKQIVIATCDHFFDGTLEDLALLEACYAKYPDCTFIEYQFDPQNPYGRAAPLAPDDLNAAHHWHNTARLVSFFGLLPEIDTVLFLDADEIMDGKRFGSWMQTFPYQNFSALRFASYWYFRREHHLATTFPDTSLLAKRSVLASENLLDEDERMGCFLRIEGEKQQAIVGEDGLPLLHHFSWVRTQKELFKKTESWGHHWEREWAALIDEEFAQDFSGRDFVRGYQYETATPFFSPLALEKPQLPPISLATHRSNLSRFSHVQAPTPQQIFRQDLLLKL